jgi:site-specific recombinase XerD
MKYDWNREYIKVSKNSTTGMWHVEGMLPHRDKNGKRERVRKRFHKREQADIYAENQRTRGENYLESGVRRLSRLTDKEENDAIAAIKILEGKELDVTLSKAVMFYAEKYKDYVSDVTLSDAVEDYLTNPKFVTKTDTHKKQFRRRLKKFEAAHDSIKLSDLESDGLEKWIYNKARDVSLTERRNEYNCLNAFLNWCVKKEKLSKNPLGKVDKPDETKRKPEALTVEEVKSVLQWAEKIHKGSMVPYFCLATFAAIRPEEIQRMDWADFDWDDKIVMVDGKGARHRSVDLPEVCIKWLKPYAKSKGSVCPDNFRKLFDLVRALAGFRLRKQALHGIDKEGYADLVKNCDSEDRPVWINDVLRHTAISFYQKLIKDVGKVADWAGNSPSMIHKHYRAVRGVTDKTCDEFWAIEPS